MKKILTLAVALLFAGGMAYAGDAHNGADLICAECHIMHASQHHDYEGAPTTYNKAPHPYLLKGTPNETCLSCHDNTPFAPDVYGTNSNSVSTYRSAGALNSASGTVPGHDDAAYPTYAGHTLASIDAAPGDTGSYPGGGEGLQCTNCHSPHGRYYGVTVSNQTFSSTAVGNYMDNGPYRNLAALLPGGVDDSTGVNVSYSKVTNDAGSDVFETASAMYETANVNLNEPSLTDSAFGSWCSKCHVNFHGDAGVLQGTEYVRHPNAKAFLDTTNRIANQFAKFVWRVRVMSAAGGNNAWGPTQDGTATWSSAAITAAKAAPTCLTCHKAHGNKNPYALVYVDGDPANHETGINEEGTIGNPPPPFSWMDANEYGMHLTCNQCHSRGGSNVPVAQ